MIETISLCKSFHNIKAIENVTTTIKDRQIMGLVGSNGAGKSTFLRLLAGVLKPDNGMIYVDGEELYENVKAKEKICFLSDTPYFFPNANAKMMCDYYASIYHEFDRYKYEQLSERFGIDEKRKISTLSKGMKKQISMILGICTNTKYLLCDETFDGLDPVMRQAVKRLFASEVLNRDFTPVIASHNLRELEDICDSIGLLHNGGVLFTKEIEDMKFHIHKVHCVIQNPLMEEKLLEELEILHYEKYGSLLTFISRGTKENILKKVKEKEPLFMETVPLSLEEIFISETEVQGYEIK